MTHFKIADLTQAGDFLEDLTPEELELNILGGASAAGSASIGQYSEKDGVVETTALTAAVAISDNQPFRIGLTHSFEPRLFVAAEAYYI